MSLVRPGAGMSTADRAKLDRQYRAAQAQKRYSSPTPKPKRLESPVSTKIDKPNVLARAYDALLNVPTVAPAGIGNPSKANNPLAQTVEPVRVAARRAVGDFTAIPGVGKPSASPTATDFKRGNYVGPVMDYANLALATAPVVAKATRYAPTVKGTSVSSSAKQLVDEVPNAKPLLTAQTTPRVRTPPHRMTRNDTFEMIDTPSGVKEPQGILQLRTYDPKTNEINGYATIVFNPVFEPGKKAVINQLFSSSPSASTQLVSAAQKISKELFSDIQFPLQPSKNLSAHSYAYVQRLQDAGLIDPKFNLPDVKSLNPYSMSDIKEYLQQAKTGMPEMETVVNPLYYTETYNDLLNSLAQSQKIRSQRLNTSAQLRKRMLPDPNKLG